MKKTLQLAKHIAASNITELSLPYRMTYIVTYTCQFKCAMCNIWKKPPYKELTTQQIEQFFKKSHHWSWINLSGGELFLRSDFGEIVDIIARYCPSLYLLDFPTNGFQTHRIVETVKKILAHHRIPKVLVTVSLNGPPSLHNTICGVPLAWDRAIETFQQLRSLKAKSFNVFLGMTLQPLNIDAVEETFDTAKEKIPNLTYSDFHLNILHHSDHYYDNARGQEKLAKEKILVQLKKIALLRKASAMNPVSFLEQHYQRLVRPYLEQQKTPIPCQALCASLFMDPEGTVYPCTIFNKPIGKITDFDYDLRLLWQSALRKQVRKEIKEKRCPQCWTPCEAYQSILADLFPLLIGLQ